MLTTESYAELDSQNAMQGLGGRIAFLDTGVDLLGELECVVLEPAGKKLAPDDYNTSGVVVCFDGMAPTAGTLNEWCGVAEAVGWLTLGVTVVIPNVQMSAALQLSDLEAVVKASLKASHFDSCLLVGKGWGAERVACLALDGDVADVVEGLVLVAPSSDPPPSCQDLEVPVFLLWAEDDDMVNFSQSEAWIEALDNRCAPTTIKDLQTGGHRFDKMLEHEGIAQALRDFTVASFLIADLDEDETSQDPTPVSRSSGRRFSRLSQELPSFLQESIGRPEPETSNGRDANSEASTALPLTSAQRTMRRLSMDLPHWIQSGLTSASE